MSRTLLRRLAALERRMPSIEHRHILRAYILGSPAPTAVERADWLAAACDGHCPRRPDAVLFLEWHGPAPDAHNGPRSDLTGTDCGTGTYAALRAGFAEERERTNR